MVKLSFGVVLALLVFATSYSSAEAASRRVERMLAAYTDWAERHNLSGATVAVMENGVVAGSVGYGTYSPRQAVPVASLSKAIAAVCIVELADKNWVSLSSTLGSQLPALFDDNPVAGKKAREITIKELLTHSSGLAFDPTQGRNFLQFQPVTQASLWAQMLAALSEPLGKKTYKYNNANYIALGLIVEAVTGETVEDYCGRAVLDPMGVTTASYNPALLARGPYGAWRISVEDYARFLQWVNPAAPYVPLRIRSWPRADAGNGAFYSLGVYLRANGNSYNVWHSGAFDWGAPINLSYGAYQVQYPANVGYVAAYTPNISSDALTDLSRTMSKAAFP